MLETYLKLVLKDEILVRPVTDGSTVLRERKVMRLEVTKMPVNLIVVNMRKIGSLSGVKEGEWKQMCDFLLIFEDEGKDYAIFIELKKTLDENSKEKGKEQLRRSLPFLKYLHSVCGLQFGADFSEPIVKYTIVAARYSQRLDKQHVKPGGRLPSENYIDISVDPIVRERINFRELWRK